MDEFKDIDISCTCGFIFTWTAGEQIFLNELVKDGKIQKVVPPKRCPACRQQRKEEQRGQEKRSYGVD